MADWIEGTVTAVVDGDTFDLNVEWVGRDNARKYDNTERIRISSVNAPEVGSPGASSATARLRNRIGGRFVHCTVRTRDTFGRLVCDVRTAQRRAG